MRIKAGNDVKLKCLCKDKAGVIISNLAAAPEIVCQIKSAIDKVPPEIEKKKTASQILVDSPITGYLRIIIEKADTEDLSGDYYIGVEVQWTDNNQELYLYDEDGNEFTKISIIPHIVR